MTAYNVMSFVLNGQADEVIDAVKWMARQRNSQVFTGCLTILARETIEINFGNCYNRRTNRQSYL